MTSLYTLVSQAAGYEPPTPVPTPSPVPTLTPSPIETFTEMIDGGTLANTGIDALTLILVGGVLIAVGLLGYLLTGWAQKKLDSQQPE